MFMAIKNSFYLEGVMAAEEGFEPSQTESESVVLPLHNSAIFTYICALVVQQRYYYILFIWFRQVFFFHFPKKFLKAQ